MTDTWNTRSWKKMIKPHKAYLQALYPAKGRSTWMQSAKKNDFIYNKETKTISPRIQNNVGVEMPIKQAIAQNKDNNIIRATIWYNDRNTTDDTKSKRHFTISIRNKHDVKMLNELLSFDSKFYKSFTKIKETFIRRHAHEYEVREAQLIADGKLQRDGQIIKIVVDVDNKNSRYAQLMNRIEAVDNWLFDSTTGNLTRNLFKYDNDEHYIWESSRMEILPNQSTGRYVSLHKNAIAGPAYNSKYTNCAIEAIEYALQPLTNIQSKKIQSLKALYSSGVHPCDYEKIAKTLNIKINVVYAPNASVNALSVFKDKSLKPNVEMVYGGKHKRIVYLHHWANHCTVLQKKKNIKYSFVSEDEMKQVLLDRYDQFYNSSDMSITLRSKSDGSFECFQLKEADGVKFELGKCSAQSMLFDQYKQQIVEYPYSDPNRPTYDAFAHHGIHYSTGLESIHDIDLDLKNAYSNYHTYVNYRGLPRDITYWINNPTDEIIKKNVGRVYCKFVEPLSNKTLVLWISTYEAEVLIDNNLMIEMYQAALAHCTFDMDITPFIKNADGSAIHKRVFHKLLGLSCQTKINKRYYTNDDLEIGQMACYGSVKLPTCIDTMEMEAEFANTKAISIHYENKNNRILHVAGTIQSITTCQIWMKWLEIKKQQPKAKLITALVDGIRMRDVDKTIINLENGRWSVKPIRYTNTSAMFDWDHKQDLHKPAIIASNTLIRADWKISIKNEYRNIMSVKKEGKLSFADLAEEGYINCIQGYAGTGKTYMIRSMLEQFNAIILTPTHSTREDMATYSIRNYLDDDELKKITVKTFQSVIQRETALDEYSVIIIDEAGMLLAEDLNRIVEIAQRKLIILVADPAQHKPIAKYSNYLHAKYIVYNEYINSNKELSDIYNNGSDFERNTMVSRIKFDCTFIAPDREEDMDDEQYFDFVEEKRTEYIDMQRKKVMNMVDVICENVGDFEEATQLFAMDMFDVSKVLTDVKRATDDEDGRKLINFSNDVRKMKFLPYSNLSTQEACDTRDANRRMIHELIIKYCLIDQEKAKELNAKLHDIMQELIKVRHHDDQSFARREKQRLYELYNKVMSELNGEEQFNLEYSTEDTIIARKCAEIDKHNNNVLQKLSCDKAMQSKTHKQLVDELKQEHSNIEKQLLICKKQWNYPGAKINIVARETFVYEKHTIYNGTKGYVKDFVMYFDNIKIPVACIRTPSHKTKTNPFKRPVLFKPFIQACYAITSYRAQGRTIGDNIINIDCSCIDKEMLYVAITRATKFSQLRFVNFNIMDVLISTSKQYRAYLETNKINLGFKVSNAKLIRATKAIEKQYTINDWFNLYEQYMNRRGHSDDIVKEQDHSADFKYLQSIGKVFYKLSDRPKQIKINEMNAYGEEESYFEECSFVARVDSNGIFGYYAFVDSKSLIEFNKRVALAGHECHQINIDDECSYFMDLDLHIPNDDLINGSIKDTNNDISKLLIDSINNAAKPMTNDRIKFSVSERSRKETNDTKISLHIYTDLGMSNNDACLFTEDVKSAIRNIVEYDDDACDKFCVIYEDIIAAIDPAQYHRNGSLAMPRGTKNGFASTILKRQTLPLINQRLGPSIYYGNKIDSYVENPESTIVSKSFIESAMKHISLIDGHQSFDFTTCRKNGRNGLRPRRTQSSFCKSCNRIHDHDNTMILKFGDNCAWFVCDKDDEHKHMIFYKE